MSVAAVYNWLSEFWSPNPAKQQHDKDGLVATIHQVWSNYRGFVYNFHFGNDKNALSTPRLYETFINRDSIRPGSRILEVGVGSGVYFKKSYIQKILKEKDLTVYGIDLDEDYIRSAKEMIVSEGIADRVQVDKIDLFDFKPAPGEAYDVILFCESAPLIPQSLMTAMVGYIRDNGLLAEDGQIVWINNLREDVSKITKSEVLIKRYAKYVPLMNVDFGETLTRSYFDGIGEAFHGVEVRYDILAEIELFKLVDVPDMAWFPNSFMQILFTTIGVKNYLVQQFMITLSNKR
jgi:protein-L-isoaspartate O-methyltransferase